MLLFDACLIEVGGGDTYEFIRTRFRSMTRKKINQFRPDYAVLPGDTLKETLDALGMSQAVLAERTDTTEKTISEIIQGKTAITPETALQLEKVLNIPAHFWNNLERNYRESLAAL